MKVHEYQAKELLGKADVAVPAGIVITTPAEAAKAYDALGGGLIVVKAHVDEGPTLKRHRPRAQGRATRIDKRTSHITVVVGPRETDEPVEKAPAKKAAAKKTADTATKAPAKKAAKKAAAPAEGEAAEKPAKKATAKKAAKKATAEKKES